MLSWTTETAPPLPLPFLRYPRKFCGILLKTLVVEDTWGIYRQNCSATFATRLKFSLGAEEYLGVHLLLSVFQF